MDGQKFWKMITICTVLLENHIAMYPCTKKTKQQLQKNPENITLYVV